ncbi:ATP synthase F0 subunit A [Galactobacter valiniphilus]|uniref:ATP synthase subunit a n=1 Tax=Galactobacter valiniphilus TaxID=2676122 RepID=A0A399JEW8_9MICC|nr:F0F1 ATP synthase subunit A [Galactobacter valiniphilus]RII42672.1 ATP synthase F0 subunit A [Galactobacter valiniphilus]
MIALALPTATEGEGFQAPGISDLHLPDILPWGAEYGTGFGKQMLLVLLSVVLIAWFMVAAARKRQLVPGKFQFLGESIYGFARNAIGRDMLGEKDFRKYTPLLTTLLLFILLNNLMGAIPFLQIPTPSHVGTAYALAGLVYVYWIFLGFKTHGIKYFKVSVVPSGVPKAFLVPVVIIEIVSTFLVRPMTHSLRLFATMLSGHMIVALTAAAMSYMFTGLGEWWGYPLGSLIFVGGLAMYLFEIFIMVLQAYVFTLLTAVYIQGSISDAH